MAGIYFHIPFCKQACSYCNFHFTISLRRKNEMVRALLDEIDLRANYLQKESIETIYFGGGTPSLLDAADVRLLMNKIHSTFIIDPNAETTIEVNPDDISIQKLEQWKQAGFNRLSIGIQSFFDEDLKWMNRAHTSAEAVNSLELAKKYFENISIDLIYGTPFMTNEYWRQNVVRAVEFDIPHLSCYALTVEPKTPLFKKIGKDWTRDLLPEKQSDQFMLLMDWMEDCGYEHYEISNFAKPGFKSRHNTSYWEGKNYLGIGPSAHSFNGNSRQWNISNNNIYINSVYDAKVPAEKEILSPTQRLNEYIMTSLRTMEGLDLDRIDAQTAKELRLASKKFIAQGFMLEESHHLRLTKNGKLLADGIASDLFQDEPASAVS